MTILNEKELKSYNKYLYNCKTAGRHITWMKNPLMTESEYKEALSKNIMHLESGREWIESIVNNWEIIKGDCNEDIVVGDINGKKFRSSKIIRIHKNFVECTVESFRFGYSLNCEYINSLLNEYEVYFEEIPEVIKVTGYSHRDVFEKISRRVNLEGINVHKIKNLKDNTVLEYI